MKKALLRRKRRKPERMIKQKPGPIIISKKESEKRGKYTRSKLKHEVSLILRDEDLALM